jgi:hypothetical protein
MSLSDYRDCDDARSLDMYNASRVVAHKTTEFQMVPERYSDDWLTLQEMHGMPGPRKAAPYLRKLDTVERRQRAVSEAYTLCNIRRTIFSHAVADAVSNMLRNIADGNESAELYGEKFARQARETEKFYREQTGNPNLIYYPSGLPQ